MDLEQHNEPYNFRKQLAVAIRSIGWTYAIFWSISSTQSGVLEWSDGYYNGDIKTRKTVQEVELDAEELGMQRSEQLIELFESLSAGECSGSQARRPSTALSPEDLTDTEWYYLVCMSFKFNIDQGLPGRTFTKNRPIWLRNAHCADSKVFSRSLLAKSADIQTVACFPISGGVIELGMTELVREDLSLIHRVETSLLEIPYPNIPKITKSAPKNSTNADNLILLPRHDDTSLMRFELDEQEYEPFTVQYPDDKVEASQVEQWQFMDDEICNSEHDSMSSIEHESQTSLNLQEHSEVTLSSMGLLANDTHYHNVLSTILKSSHCLFPEPKPQNTIKESSFVRWKSGGFVEMPRVVTSQRLLKKVLFEVAQSCRFHDSREDNGQSDGHNSAQVDEIGSNHVLAERRRRKNINDKFMVLGSLVPSMNKVDKLSILDNTIEYLKGLEKRVEELVASKEARGKQLARTRRKRPINSKRKAREMDETEPETVVVVNVNENEAVIEVRCPWKESLLLQIMDTIGHLQLDSYSVQSINANGVLSMTIKSKWKGSKAASAGTIKKALQRVVNK